MDNQPLPLSEKDVCVIILTNRIKDIRREEEQLIQSGTMYDKTRFAKKIWGIKKCIQYILAH